METKTLLFAYPVPGMPVELVSAYESSSRSKWLSTL